MEIYKKLGCFKQRLTIDCVCVVILAPVKIYWPFVDFVMQNCNKRFSFKGKKFKIISLLGLVHTVRFFLIVTAILLITKNYATVITSLTPI